MSSDLPQGWRSVPLEDVCELVSVGYVGETSSAFTGLHGVPFLRSQNVRPNRVDLSDIKYVTPEFHARSRKSRLQAGDLLIVRVGQNRGDCAVLPPDLGEVNCANIVFARPCPTYSHYLGAYFNTPEGHDALLAVSSGSAQLVLNTKAVAKIKVPIPSPGEARDLGLLSRTLDDRITLLRETNTTLEAIAQALFKSWFVDFDPVRAKMEGRAPEGMDQATAALFPDGFEGSELGVVPKGWAFGTLADLARQHKGSVNPLHHPNTLFEHFSLPAFDNERMPVNELGGEIKSNKTTVPSDAVLLSKLNPHIPRVWLPLSPNEHAVCSTEFLVFVPAGGPAREFIYCAFRSASVQERLCQLVTGTSNSHQRVKPDAVLKMHMVVPNGVAIAAFADVAKPLFAQAGFNRLQAQTLVTLRDTLLPRLISGQLRLPAFKELLDEIS